MDYKFTLDNFELEFSKTDEKLLIQAKDQLTGDLFLKDLNQEIVKPLSQDYNLDINIVFELLRDFFQRKPEKAALKMTKDGQLIYSCQVLMGTLCRDMSFTIDLEKKELEPLSKLDKLVSEHSKQLSELEKALKDNKDDIFQRDFAKFSEANDRRFQTLEKMMLEKFEKIEKLLVKTDMRLQILEEKQADKNKPIKNQGEKNLSPWKFDTSGAFSSKFTFTNNGRTALSKTGFPSCIFAKDPIPKQGKTHFTFLIEGHNYTVIGIAPKAALTNGNCIADAASVGVCYNGLLYHKKRSTQNSATFTKGDKILFNINMNNGNISISINSKTACTYTLPKNHLKSNTFYPYLYTNYHVGAGVTFI